MAVLSWCCVSFFYWWCKGLDLCACDQNVTSSNPMLDRIATTLWVQTFRKIVPGASAWPLCFTLTSIWRGHNGIYSVNKKYLLKTRDICWLRKSSFKFSAILPCSRGWIPGPGCLGIWDERTGSSGSLKHQHFRDYPPICTEARSRSTRRQQDRIRNFNLYQRRHHGSREWH